MDELLPSLICLGIGVFFIIVNYVMVTIQERRTGKPEPAEIDYEALAHERIHELLAEGNTIGAIKLYMEMTNLGLKESKDAIDFARQHPDEILSKKRSPQQLDLDEAPGIRDLLEDGREDEAVDVYRKFAGVDEYTARDAVARIKSEME